ncbi:protein-L-isoaspartate O-methyltransferase [bacterium]|nr:MAG: protein-L-isoaspartate O-methyltransferase [bacterium]
MKTNQKLINHLVEIGALKMPEIIEAFLKIDRKFFVPKDLLTSVYEDYPLPIGYGATISQPYTVAFMMELLRPKKGEKILDVGSGSGWTTALLSQIVGEKGQVFGIEIVPELVEFGRKNLKKYNLKNTQILRAGHVLGLPSRALFDKILASASALKIPKEFLAQLASPGILVMPIERSIWKIEKGKKGKMTQEEFPGFSFVPLKYIV